MLNTQIGKMPRATPRRFVAGLAASGCASTVFARTGGGNHGGFSSSSSSGGYSGGHSGGFSGSGGSFGGMITLLIIVLIVGYVLRRVRRNSPAMTVLGSALGGSAMGASLARLATGNGGSNTGGLTHVLPPAVDAIRAADPAFEMETFLQRAEMTFFLVKRGIQKNAAAAIRPYLNDRVFALVSQSIVQSKAAHRHALLESLNVRGLALEDAQCTAQGQSMQVHFDLVYRAKTLDDANRVLTDEGQDGRHAEVWTFSRNASARTAINGGVIAARCPSCGAELRLNTDGTCAHCRASVTNGTVDWVVSDVRPAAFVGYSGDSALGIAAPTVPDGVAALTAADKDFSLGVFEARVKKAFLTLQDAWCKQNLDAGRAFMSPGAYFTWSAQLETMAAEGRRDVMENLSVRAIQAIRIVHGRVFDDLTVRINAAAADYEVDKNGNIVYGDRSVRPFTEDWTFQRSVGVTTSNRPGTLENTCPSCGAPVSLTQIGECRYCKAAVTSGKFDWVVSRIEQEDAATDDSGALGNVGEAVALQVGGAIVGGLLSSFLSDRRN